MFQSALQSEISRIVLISGTGALIGWTGDMTLYGFLTGLIISQLFSVKLAADFFRWTTSRDSPPVENGLIGYATDRLIRRERRLQAHIAELLHQLRRYNDGIEALQDGVITLGSRGHINTYNSAAQRMFRLHPDDIGQHINNLIRAPLFVQFFNQGEFTKALQFDYRSATFLVQVSEFGADQKVMLLRDVTERKRVEVMRKHFVADVSHELRTPLTVINGYLEMLQDAEVPAHVHRAHEQMLSQSQRMTLLVNDLIELSRLESASTERPGEWFNIREICQQTLSQLQNYREGGVLTLVDGEPVEVEGYPDEMRTVMVNLVTNALKYGGDGEVVVRLKKTMRGLKISVTDHGPGIPAEHLGRITERFYRVDDSRDSTTGGSGLGLAIVKHALEHLDTELQIESTPGAGSTFSFIVPQYRVR
ncbi:MAG: phosphate regulon sensor histidine kinase PhoR [Oceanospirillaceae bacterium]|nr:phosphate regulon sensor histidine kinase PhoR [Oceanospirillaceae bacterium]